MTQILADWLTQRFPTAKKLTLRRMVAEGRVRVNGRRALRFHQPIVEADTIVVDESPPKAKPGAMNRSRPAGGTNARRPAPAAGEVAPPEIVYEDADVLVVNKPPGLLTSTVPREPRPTLLAMVRDYCAATDRRARVG